MHSVKRILTTENRTCAIRPTAIQSHTHTHTHMDSGLCLKPFSNLIMYYYFMQYVHFLLHILDLRTNDNTKI